MDDLQRISKAHTAQQQLLATYHRLPLPTFQQTIYDGPDPNQQALPNNPVITFTVRCSHSPLRTPIFLTALAYNYFRSHANSPGTLSLYIATITATNPDPRPTPYGHYYDNRANIPDTHHLPALDEPRSLIDRMPIWALDPQEPRIVHDLILPPSTLAVLTQVARAHLIGRTTYRVDHDTNMQTSLTAFIEQNYLNPDRPAIDKRLAGYALNAIGESLLIPTQPMPPRKPYTPRKKPARSYSHPWPGHPL